MSPPKRPMTSTPHLWLLREQRSPMAYKAPMANAAATDENWFVSGRPSSAFPGTREPVYKTDAGIFPAPRTVCFEHACQGRHLGLFCRAPHPLTPISGQSP